MKRIAALLAILAVAPARLRSTRPALDLALFALSLGAALAGIAAAAALSAIAATAIALRAPPVSALRSQ